MTKPVKAETHDDGILGPSVISAMHRKDRPTAPVAGAPLAYRRIDRLQWLFDHKTIQQHQLDAGRRFQDDWQMSKIEPAARMVSGTGGGSSPGTLSDAKLDAIDRVNKAVSILPSEPRKLLELFLCPEDHPMSLERCAAVVRMHPKAASMALQISLSLLARHYGFLG